MRFTSLSLICTLASTAVFAAPLPAVGEASTTVTALHATPAAAPTPIQVAALDTAASVPAPNTEVAFDNLPPGTFGSFGSPNQQAARWRQKQLRKQNKYRPSTGTQRKRRKNKRALEPRATGIVKEKVNPPVNTSGSPRGRPMHGIDRNGRSMLPLTPEEVTRQRMAAADPTGRMREDEQKRKDAGKTKDAPLRPHRGRWAPGTDGTGQPLTPDQVAEEQMHDRDPARRHRRDLERERATQPEDGKLEARNVFEDIGILAHHAKEYAKERLQHLRGHPKPALDSAPASGL